MVEFGQLLRTTRLDRGWTQAYLAKQLNVSKGYISRVEGGKARPAIQLIQCLAKVCVIDPDPLLILAGHLPSDVREILSHHPVDAPARLREAFAEQEYVTDDSVHPVGNVVFEQNAAYDRPGGTYELVHQDCFEWMEHRSANSIHAIVTDPPYGLKEYSAKEKAKLRRGEGGVWRIPPALGGCIRRPLPRFTVLSQAEKMQLAEFFRQWATRAFRTLVPGGHIFIATNPLLSHLVYVALLEGGFEKRGEIIRLVQTLRGGDRPKNAHLEFSDVSVMPRSCWEPWGLFRKPCEGRVQDNLRKWKTGGLRRISEDQPFSDVIRSSPTRSLERSIVPHPSLKPQGFMRQIVRAALPLGEGVILDPFMGGGSTIAAANAIGYESIGIESDAEFFTMAQKAISDLATIVPDGSAGNGRPRKLTESEKAQATLFD